MRIYSAFDEETLRIRQIIKNWSAERFINDAQRERMERDASCELRRTNGFLRVVLFLFTLGSAAAAIGLFFVLFFAHDTRHEGIVLMAFAGLSLAGAEYAVTRARFYRHGIEEALAVLSVLLLCSGLEMVIVRGYSSPVIPAVGLLGSFLLYRRYGYQYAFLAALILAAVLPHYWRVSPDVERLLLGTFYGISLGGIIAIRRRRRGNFLDEEYSTPEALLWLSLYLTVNLYLTSVRLLRGSFGTIDALDFSKYFYWMTYALIWILPALMMHRALRRKDRPLVGLGIVMALLTLITNKSYLGWTRHEWDPMLLGVFLVGLVLLIRRQLAQGADGVRWGFTARRMSSQDKQFLNVLAGASVGQSIYRTEWLGAQLIWAPLWAAVLPVVAALPRRIKTAWGS